MSYSIRRGMVIIPKIPDPDSPRMRIYGYQSRLIGYHVYLGHNRWLLPSGRMTTHQSFHKKILAEMRYGWWEIV